MSEWDSRRSTFQGASTLSLMQINGLSGVIPQAFTVFLFARKFLTAKLNVQCMKRAYLEYNIEWFVGLRRRRFSRNQQRMHTHHSEIKLQNRGQWR